MIYYFIDPVNKGGYNMGKSEIILDAVFSVAERAVSGKVGKFICGEYLDGPTRSIPDALAGELKSPKQRRKEEKQKKEQLRYEAMCEKPKKKHKKSKKKKHKNKKAVLKL